ncbi:C-Jun-amino-terminal kinase-interacting protein 3 isoform X2 [Esox lucius]|uniref:C-Jun-amino-terminal kinase-interacting protein 3 isoform X2 n=1 Tax=Esox lucius TaxID=8010 RepID=UPI0014769F8C|nr:C-Jun-amino-terminal kinase-interacting protein 3 isoform X2 [Esox lucius]
MDCGESILCGSAELDLDPDVVSEEAGRLYSELQTVIETHGAGVVESLVPILVWILEGLASCRAQLREREEEAERDKEEREELFERYQSEKLLRRESQERYLELDDQIEQERRTIRGREKERERREKELEKKAREQADQLVALEEQRTCLGRELNTLKHTHNKLVLSYKDLLDRKKELEREGSPLRNHVTSNNSGGLLTPALSCVKRMEQTHLRQETPPDSALLERSVTSDSRVIDIVLKPDRDPSFINDIISSTPELAQFHGLVEASTPVRADPKEPIGEDPNTSLEKEIKEEEEKEGEKENDEEDMDILELELRNTESVFSELSDLSPEYVESVDQGATVRGSADQVEQILSQYGELKHTHELVDAARKALISRVEELTNERSALKLELTSCQESITRFEGRMKEVEEETKRLRKELEANQSDEDSSLRRFSRSEMARVVMERNQYKERLFELQEAVRRSQTIRAAQEERVTERERTSVWKRFNRLFGLNKDPLVASGSLAPALPTSPSLANSPLGSPRKQTVSRTVTEGASPAAGLSPRDRRRELYREIRSHVWGVLGKRQIHGWSMPLSHTQESSEPTPEPKDVPILVQLRLLDQRDATAKLNCAVAVTPEISGETTCAVWAVSGPASSSDITVIDPARSNTVLDQFSLPPTSPALCICAVPPTGETSGTVWIGTQEGSVLVHSASTARRRCLQSVSLSEGVHSLTYSQGQVIAGLANGTLAFFSHHPDGWDLQSHDVLPLEPTPLQPIRCCLAKGAGLWVGYWNCVHVVDLENRKVKQTINVSERCEQQVRFMCAAGSGVWTSCRLDPTLRLFDWSTGRPLQEVDLTPLVTKTLGPAFLSLSPLQISSFAIISGRLWVGTGSGAIFSIPVSLSSESASIPYCSLATAQLCNHGHRQAVKVIIAAPGCVTSSSTSGGGSATLVSTSMLILSGGEGYINFRIGDDTNDGALDAAPLRSERSHMIIWQSPTPSLPTSAF